MKKYQVIYFKNPAIKRGKKIVKNKECQHRNQDIDKETEMGMQYMIFSKDEKCLLNKHRNHQGKRDDNEKRSYIDKRITFTRRQFPSVIKRSRHIFLLDKEFI